MRHDTKAISLFDRFNRPLRFETIEKIMTANSMLNSFKMKVSLPKLKFLEKPLDQED